MNIILPSTTNLSPKKLILKVTALLFVIGVSVLGMTIPANAAQITGRSVLLSSSAGAATGVTYTLTTAALPTTTAIQSMEIRFCTSLTVTCTAGSPATPSGFSSGSSTLASQPTGLGAASGWTNDVTSTGALRIKVASNATPSSGAVSVTWNGVANPTANNTTFYGIITTYSDNAWTTPRDSGSVAVSTSTQIQVNLTVNEALTFCTGTSITGQDCSTVSGSVVALGTGTTTSTANGTSVMAASTNAATGYSITYKGPTLTSGAGDTIAALNSGNGAVSTIGTQQFGLNLINNTTPAVGAVVNGTGSGAPYTTAKYGTANNFYFTPVGDTVAQATVPTNANTYTVSYIANISGVTKPGAYTTTINYIATANF